MRASINMLSAEVGNDPLLVQGAGGNISWKTADSLYVKGSGTWLADALTRDIYACVNLSLVRQMIVEGRADYVAAQPAGQSALRPSIETALHALLPQCVVLHLHPVDVIAFSVMPDGKGVLEERLAGLDWAWVDYVKPGKDLADAVMKELVRHKDAPRIWVLANHGLVIAGETPAAVAELLADVIHRVAIPVGEEPVRPAVSVEQAAAWQAAGYRFVSDPRITEIAFDPRRLAVSQQAWVLYPDHAVFLGANCAVLDVPAQLCGDKPVVVVVPGIGVCIAQDAPKAADGMLLCYSEVLARLPGPVPVGLSSAAVAELLNWDAEKFRKNMQFV